MATELEPRSVGTGMAVEQVFDGLTIVLDEASRDAAAKDWWPVAGKWTSEETVMHRPLAVLRPKNEADVVAAVLAAAEHGFALVARGAGSGVVGAVVGEANHVSLDLADLNKTVDLDEERFLVTVDAGKLAGELEQELNAQGYTLGHYPQSLYLASVGGLVATRSCGTFSNKYGGIENLVLGLRVVLADGSVIVFRPTPRSATGPYLLPLFIGSEGSLGIITQATLRVFPLTERHFGGYKFPSLDAAVRAVREGFARHVVPAVLRIYDDVEAQNLYKHVGLTETSPLLIVGYDGPAEITQAESRLFSEIAVRAGAEWLGPEIGHAWEQHRFNADWLVKGNTGPGCMADAIEVSAAWPDIMPIYDEVRATVAGDCSLFMGHMSHFYSSGGALYIIFAIEAETSDVARERYTRIWEETLRITLKHGGSISHHHGVGKIRSGALAGDLGSAHQLLSTIKAALDPASLLNPGKLGIDETQGSMK